MKAFPYETYAYSNRFVAVHPAIKGAFALGLLGLALASPGMAYSLLILAVAVGAGFAAGVPFGRILRLLVVPGVFLTVGVLALLVGVGRSPEGFWQPLAFGGYYVGILPEQWNRAAELAMRSLAAVAALNFLILTTPIPDLLAAGRRIGMPPWLLELFHLVYRFIFVTWHAYTQIRLAQEVRLGYRGAAATRRSLGLLGGTLGMRTFWRAKELEHGAQARGYRGELVFLSPQRPLHKGMMALVFTLLGTLGVIAWYGWR